MPPVRFSLARRIIFTLLYGYVYEGKENAVWLCVGNTRKPVLNVLDFFLKKKILKKFQIQMLDASVLIVLVGSYVVSQFEGADFH